jgi:hypothetical protein
MGTLGDNIKPKLSQKSATKYFCENCDYGTCKKSNYESHIESAKHKKVTNGYIEGQKSAKKQPKIEKNQHIGEIFTCFCGKEYIHRQGLWRHKKNCIIQETCVSEHENTIITNNPTDKNLIMMLIKENSELKTMMMEQQSMMMKVIENGTHNTINTTNSHNKAFNLNLFLNETCKDAMNINDFVESIKLQVSDLENVGEVGFVEGISNIIVKNLNALDVTKRPIHCTDKKREIIYIKDDNIWEKDESQGKMRRMIKKVVSKNQRLIPKFKEQNPEYNKSYSKVSDKYNKLIIESMGGSGDNDAEKEDKIVRNILKNVVVDKSV